MPIHLRERVCNFEYQRWVAMGGLDETELIKGLPDGLRRDIKRYLCLDLVKKVHFRIRSAFKRLDIYGETITFFNLCFSYIQQYKTVSHICTIMFK